MKGVTMHRLIGTAAVTIMLVIGLSACSSGSDDAADDPSVIVSPPAGFTPEAKYTEMCTAFNEIAASPQAAVLADDTASQNDITAALGVVGPELQSLVDDYGSVMPADVATEFTDWVAGIESIVSLNDSSSITDAAKALRGLATLKSTGAQLDSFTETACGTSLGF